MKWSKYNRIVYDNSRWYIFNYLYNSIVEIQEELVSIVRLNQENVNGIKEIHPDLYDYFIQNNYILDNNKNELDECLHILDQRYNSKNQLRIVINPTLDCNLRCWYCYESIKKGSSASKDVFRNLIKLIKKSMKNTELNTVHLSFFGGEPLLKTSNFIIPLISEVKPICDEFGKKFIHSYTTNAVLLTPKVTDLLFDISKEFHIQVPFDGGKEFHNKTKSFPSGRGSYEIVLNNIKYAIKKGVKVNVRCNYTNENISSFQELIGEFKSNNSQNLQFSLHKVWQEKETAELISNVSKIGKLLDDNNIPSNIQPLERMSKCYADFNNNFVLNYNGDIYQCTARDFNPENRLGVLNAEGVIKYNSKYRERERSRIFFYCKECPILPICTVCSQDKHENGQLKCPADINSEKAEEHINRYFRTLMKTN